MTPSLPAMWSQAITVPSSEFRCRPAGLLRLLHDVDNVVARHIVWSEFRLGNLLQPALRLFHVALLNTGVDDLVVRCFVKPKPRFGVSLELLRETGVAKQYNKL